MATEFREDRYVVTHRDGTDTIHRNPREECNLDDTTADKVIDAFTFEAMLIRGDAKPCGHCVGDGTAY